MIDEFDRKEEERAAEIAFLKRAATNAMRNIITLKTLEDNAPTMTRPKELRSTSSLSTDIYGGSTMPTSTIKSRGRKSFDTGATTPKKRGGNVSVLSNQLKLYTPEHSIERDSRSRRQSTKAGRRSDFNEFSPPMRTSTVKTSPPRGVKRGADIDHDQSLTDILELDQQPLDIQNAKRLLKDQEKYYKGLKHIAKTVL